MGGRAAETIAVAITFENLIKKLPVLQQMLKMFYVCWIVHHCDK